MTQFCQLFGPIFAWQFSQQLVPNSAKILWNKRHFDSNFFVEKKSSTSCLQNEKYFFKIFSFLLNGFDSKNVPILQNMGVGTVTQIQAFSSSIANLEFSTKIWRNDEPKELGSTTFVAKIWTRVPHPNPYECWLHAPNVGSSSTLFVPNKKSIRGCDAIEKKMLRIFPSQRSA